MSQKRVKNMEMILDVFKSAEVSFKSPELRKLANGLANHPELSSPLYIEFVKDMAYWAFVHNDYSLADKLCDCTSWLSRKFGRIEESVTYATVLKAHLLRTSGDAETADKLVISTAERMATDLGCTPQQAISAKNNAFIAIGDSMFSKNLTQKKFMLFRKLVVLP